MGLCDDVRSSCAAIAARARWVSIDADALAAVGPGREPALDPREHLLEGSPEDVALFTLTLDSINFGSGWFPTLRKRPGRSGSRTVAAAFAEHARAEGTWGAAQLRELDAAAVARTLDQEPGHELMGLYAQALRQLGGFVGDRPALDVIAAAGGSAQKLASQLAAGMPFFDDRDFYKRAQIVPSDLALAGVAEFTDLDRLTIFADNLVPHVLRVEGVLRYDAGLAALIDAEELLPAGDQEREIRACAVHACELIAARLAVAPRTLDTWLWNRGQQSRYKAVPRHRTRTVYY
jgi:hypothetical protein